MKKLLVVVLSCLCVAVFAGNFQWDTSVYEGYINTDTSWKGGVAPGSGDSIVSTHSSGDYTVRFPAADYVPGFKEVQFLLTGKASVTVDGRGGTFAMPVPPDGEKYGGAPFSFRTQTSNGLILDFEDWKTYKVPMFWTNAFFKVERTDSSISKASIDLDWNGGDLVARDFDTGMTLAIPTAKAYNYRFHAGTVVLPIVKLGCNATDGLLFETDGAAIDAAYLQFPGGNKNIGTYAPTNRVHVTGTGSLKTRTTANAASFGSSAATTDNVFMLEADNGGKISLAGHVHTSPGTLFFNIHDNGTLEYADALANGVPMWSNADGADTVVRLTDSTLLFKAYGAYGSSKTGRVDFRAERSRIFSSCGEYFQDGDYVLTDSAYTNSNNGSGLYLGSSSSATIAGCVARMTLVDSSLKTFNLYVGNKGGEGHFTMTGGVATCGGALFASYENAASCGEIVLVRDAKLTVASTMGMGVRGRCSVTVRDGAELAGTISKTGYEAHLGSYAGAVGEMTVEGGTVTFKSTGLAVGKGGTGTLTMKSGDLSAVAVGVGTDAGGVGTLNLLGGRVCGTITGGAGTGTLFANGGTFKATAASSTISALGAAKIGSKGLTIDNGGFDIAVSQAFTAAEDDTSVLILKGDKEKGSTTLTGDLSGVDTLVADEGSVDLSGLAINNLVATNAAVLTVTPGTAIAVSGSATFANVRFAFATPVVVGTTYDIFTVGTALSSDSAAALGEALVVSGADNLVVDFLVEDNGAGGSLVSATVRLPQTTEIRLDSGTSVDAADHINKPVDSFAAIVGADADLTLSGTLKRGGLTKTGDGAVTVTSSANEFVGGIVVDGGLFAASEVAALGGADVTLKAGTLAVGNTSGTEAKVPGKLTLSTAADDTLTVLRADGDIAFAAPTVEKGILVKSGAGSLAFDATASMTLSKNGGALPSGNPDASERKVNGGVYVPTGVFGGLNIAEGELQLRGTSPSVKYTITPSIMVGVNATDAGLSAQPKLTVANARVESTLSASFLHLGGGIPAGSFVTAPELCLTNAYLDVTSLRVGSGSTQTGLVSSVHVVDSTLHSRWAIELNAGLGEEGGSNWSFVNSRLQSGNNIALGENRAVGTAVMDFDHSTVAKDDKDVILPYLAFQNGSKSVLDATFRNGSDFRVAEVQTYVGSFTGRHRLAFDGSSWTPSTGDAELIVLDPQCLGLVATGAGFRLAPPADATWTLYQPVIGDGAIVKEGAGTLVLETAQKWTSSAKSAKAALDDPVVVKCTNGVRVVAGTVRVANGAVAEGTRFSGSGRLSGVLPKPVFAYAAGETLTLADCTLSGRTKVDFDGTVAAVGDELRVLACEGVKPDVSTWRAVNLTNADGERLCGTFKAEGGVITMTATTTPGMILILR